jgi:hypothetical protein
MKAQAIVCTIRGGKYTFNELQAISNAALIKQASIGGFKRLRKPGPKVLAFERKPK